MRFNAKEILGISHSVVTYQSFHDFIRGIEIWYICQKTIGDRLQRFVRPITEPVYGAAVDKRRKLSEASSEYLTNWTENENHRLSICVPFDSKFIYQN